MKMEGLNEELKLFQTFIWKSRWVITVCSVIFVLVFGAWFFDIDLHIDAENALLYPLHTSGWLDVGRYGLIVTELVFGIRWYNPIISASFGYILLFVSGILFSYVLWRANGMSHNLMAAFGALCFVSPIVTEQLYFVYQLFQIAWAYCLCAIAVGLAYYGIIHREKWAKLTAVVCMLWAFASYQIFIAIYVTAIAVCFVLLYRRWTIQGMKDISAVEYGKMIGWQIGMFIVAYALNTVIAKIFFSHSDYLDTMISWGTVRVSQCITNILEHIWRSTTGSGIYYTVFFGIFALMTVVLMFCEAIKAKKRPLRWLYLIAGISVQLAPFLMTVYMGQEPLCRSQLAYPFVLACDIMVLIELSSRKGWIQAVCVYMAVVMLWSQANIATRLIYTDLVTIEEDRRLSKAIVNRIYDVAPYQNKVAFVGGYVNELNSACIRGEIIGLSKFNCNASVEPHYWLSSYRSCQFMQTFGYAYSSVSENEMKDARKTALTMPSWPEVGSVVDAGDYVIVKLSEDYWKDELILDGQ